MTKFNILVVDDELLIRESLKEIIEYEGHIVSLAANGNEALEILKTKEFDVVFCDIKMPKKDGIEVLMAAQEFTSAQFIMLSGHGNIETAVECIKKGAFDFIEKPLDLNRVLVSLNNAVTITTLKQETKRLKKQVGDKYEIIGESKVLQEALEICDKAAATSVSILITGESGTGKELLARRIHKVSELATSDFVEVNCAAIPTDLIESELFGHEKGSFTSAIKQRKGSFEQADGGTLFLDEIGDMSLSAQAKVLRSLQDGKIMRVGGEKAIEVNVRVIAATNKDLKKEIELGAFREDLYHRLGVIVVKLPALRERKEDIPFLITYFVDAISLKMGKQPLEVTPEAIKFLQNQAWLGNIRELRNVVERLLILCTDFISEEDVKKYI